MAIRIATPRKISARGVLLFRGGNLIRSNRSRESPTHVSEENGAGSGLLWRGLRITSGPDRNAAWICGAIGALCCLKPECPRNLGGVDFSLLPPLLFVTMTMEIPVVADAKWHGKLIGDFAPHGLGLGEFQVMGLGGCAATNEAGLSGDHFEVIPVTNPFRLRKSKLAFINSVRAMRGGLRNGLDRMAIHSRLNRLFRRYSVRF